MCRIRTCTSLKLNDNSSTGSSSLCSSLTSDASLCQKMWLTSAIYFRVTVMIYYNYIAIDLMQVVVLPAWCKFVIKLYRALLHWVKSNLWQSEWWEFLKQLAPSVWIRSLDNQLPSSLLTTCSRRIYNLLSSLFTICLQLVYNLFTTCLQLVYNLLGRAHTTRF